MAASKNLVDGNDSRQRYVWEVDLLTVEAKILVLITEHERSDPSKCEYFFL